MNRPYFCDAWPLGLDELTKQRMESLATSILQTVQHHAESSEDLCMVVLVSILEKPECKFRLEARFLASTLVPKVGAGCLAQNAHVLLPELVQAIQNDESSVLTPWFISALGPLTVCNEQVFVQGIDALFQLAIQASTRTHTIPVLGMVVGNEFELKPSSQLVSSFVTNVVTQARTAQDDTAVAIQLLECLQPWISNDIFDQVCSSLWIQGWFDEEVWMNSFLCDLVCTMGKNKRLGEENLARFHARCIGDTPQFLDSRSVISWTRFVLFLATHMDHQAKIQAVNHMFTLIVFETQQSPDVLSQMICLVLHNEKDFRNILRQPLIEALKSLDINDQSVQILLEIVKSVIPLLGHDALDYLEPVLGIVEKHVGNTNVKVSTLAISIFSTFIGLCGPEQVLDRVDLDKCRHWLLHLIKKKTVCCRASYFFHVLLPKIHSIDPDPSLWELLPVFVGTGILDMDIDTVSRHLWCWLDNPTLQSCVSSCLARLALRTFGHGPRFVQKLVRLYEESPRDRMYLLEAVEALSKTVDTCQLQDHLADLSDENIGDARLEVLLDLAQSFASHQPMGWLFRPLAKICIQGRCPKKSYRVLAAILALLDDQKQLGNGLIDHLIRHPEPHCGYFQCLGHVLLKFSELDRAEEIVHVVAAGLKASNEKNRKMCSKILTDFGNAIVNGWHSNFTIDNYVDLLSKTHVLASLSLVISAFPSHVSSERQQQLIQNVLEMEHSGSKVEVFGLARAMVLNFEVKSRLKSLLLCMCHLGSGMRDVVDHCVRVYGPESTRRALPEQFHRLVPKTPRELPIRRKRAASGSRPIAPKKALGTVAGHAPYAYVPLDRNLLIKPRKTQKDLYHK